jgi:hypothetical protein
MRGDVGLVGLAASLVLVAVAVALSLVQRLRLERAIAWAAIRAIVQLLAVGAALALVIAPDAPLRYAWLWVGGMMLVGRAAAQPVVQLHGHRRHRRGGDVADQRVEAPAVEVVKGQLCAVPARLAAHDQPAACAPRRRTRSRRSRCRRRPRRRLPGRHTVRSSAARS